MKRDPARSKSSGIRASRTGANDKRDRTFAPQELRADVSKAKLRQNSTPGFAPDSTGTDQSAHDVLRSSLTRSDDRRSPPIRGGASESTDMRVPDPACNDRRTTPHAAVAAEQTTGTSEERHPGTSVQAGSIRSMERTPPRRYGVGAKEARRDLDHAIKLRGNGRLDRATSSRDQVVTGAPGAASRRRLAALTATD